MIYPVRLIFIASSFLKHCSFLSNHFVYLSDANALAHRNISIAILVLAKKPIPSRDVMIRGSFLPASLISQAVEKNITPFSL